MDYRVLLYYKYTTIDDPETFAAEHLEFCKSNNLKGRILVSEGINGTLSGTKEDTDKYIEHMQCYYITNTQQLMTLKHLQLST